MATATKNKSKGESSEYFRYTIKDDSPLLARDIRTQVTGCHWTYQTQMLDILDWVVSNDRQHALARKRMLDLINNQERSMRLIIDGAFMQKKEADANDG
jgi:hypothetical protein